MKAKSSFLNCLLISLTSMLLLSCDYQDGYEQGEKKGYKKGYETGETEGFSSGYKVGKKKGFSEGKKEGFTGGHEQGLAKGHKKGFSEGYRKAIVEWVESNSLMLLSVILAAIAGTLLAVLLFVCLKNPVSEWFLDICELVHLNTEAWWVYWKGKQLHKNIRTKAAKQKNQATLDALREIEQIMERRDDNYQLQKSWPSFDGGEWNFFPEKNDSNTKWK